jgi:NADPH:quinone reductase-like Zn-dependent oxidoreductase
MIAAVVHQLGAPPRCGQFAEPVAADSEVIVHVHAAALKPVDRQIVDGAHYAAPRQFPFVCGTDGVSHLDDGRRVFFGSCRPPYGAMAQRTLVPAAFTFPLPDDLDDELAAAVANPGVSAWLALTYRAKLAPGEIVLVLGATGVTGRLAVRIAKLLGAARVTAAGRNPEALQKLLQLGADSTLRLDLPAPDLQQAFLQHAGESGFQVVIDYLWGQPTEAFLSAITGTSFAAIGAETRLVQAGESAGPAISLPAAVLRSTALTILGTAGIPPREVLTDALQRILAHAASGDLHVDTARIPLADIESAWQQTHPGRRTVIIA